MSQNPTGFDAFFTAVTSSPEFRDTMQKDWKGDSLELLEKSLLNMEEGVKKASDIMKTYDEKFGTPSLSDPTGSGTGNPTGNGGSTPPKTGNPQDEKTESPIEVQRFVKKEGKPWGFEAVAGMESLKEELKDSFIKPLRFKFLIEKLKREEALQAELPEDQKLEKKMDVLPSEKKKHELMSRLYSEYEKYKISIPTGMLFYGPPGTGKTFVTKKLAEELGCGFVSKNLGEFGSSYLHQTTKNIKDFFDAAKKAAENEPIILFLDEVDSLVSARTDRVDANKAEEISQFLQEFNALESAPNLIVIAATNRPDHLDPAILRSGRLDKKVYLGPPDAVARRELFKMYIEKAGRPHKKLDYEELARLSDGYVSADIEAMCDEVARDASRDLLELVDEAESGTLTEKHLKGHEISMDDIRKTITETPSSLKMVDMSIYESWLEKIQ
ncbi:ATP-binding protein [Candidatus Gracilibacteria bacterium]|nr:ATP-binding protein [Candidatus Gracilibacteria bacterium]